MKKGHRGFTLLELVVALFLISVITAVILPALAGFGDRKVKTEAREIASILRSLNDSAISRKEPYWITFDLDGNIVRWISPDGEKKKGFDSLTGVATQSAGMLSKGEVTIPVEALGFRENISVLLGSGDKKMTIMFNHLNGRVKITEKG